MASKLNLISWNVNGIRAIVKKDFVSQVKMLNPDILCLQETKAQKEEVRAALSLLPEYKTYVNASKARKGYSGTAILTKCEPVEVNYDIQVAKHDQEGRVITVEYPDYYLVTVYVPNSGRGLVRLDYRKTWDKAFRRYLRNLEQKKPVIACGDFNVAHQSIDLANPKPNYDKTAGYTQVEIDGFTKLLKDGFIDSFRYFNPETIAAYSYWSYMFNARENNTGWRIDYFLCSSQLESHVSEPKIYPDYRGSDHCPVGLNLTL
jgi:exodeoxyribonuclease-3